MAQLGTTIEVHCKHRNCLAYSTSPGKNGKRMETAELRLQGDLPEVLTVAVAGVGLLRCNVSNFLIRNPRKGK